MSGAMREPPPSGSASRYLGTMAVCAVACAALLAGLCFAFEQSLTAITRDDDPDWYRDYGGRGSPEINDQDFFYQGIGPSVAAARAADIVVLGPSFTAHAFDGARMGAFGAAHGVKLYNMSFIGIRGGEFSRRIAERWGLRARLWIINVDDQLIHFFSRSTDLTIGSNQQPIPTLGKSRLHALLDVMGRTIRWRLQDWLSKSRHPFDMYRNARTGDMAYDAYPAHVAADNKPLVITRDPNCHAAPEAVASGRDLLHSLGGAAVFILVPHSQYCPQQARELAAALGVPLILAPPQDYSSIDGGGHLDKKSAVRFTDVVLGRVAELSVFRSLFGKAGD